MKKTFDTLAQDEVETLFDYIVKNRTGLEDLFNKFKVPVDFIKRVLENNGLALELVPDEIKMQYPEICTMAVKKCPRAFESAKYSRYR